MQSIFTNTLKLGYVTQEWNGLFLCNYHLIVWLHFHYMEEINIFF